MIPRALPLWAAAAAVGLLPLHAAQAASSVKFPDKVCDITHYLSLIHISEPTRPY